MPRKKPRSRGIRLPAETSQSLVPLRVRMCVMLVVKRPYSAANGLASTSTDSMACAGRSRSNSPVDGSMRLALLTWSAPCVGWPPRMRSRPLLSRTTPGSSGSRLRKSSPSSGAVSNSRPDSMSLIETGCTLSVADGASARTSTSSGAKVSRVSSSTCVVSPARTVKGAESRSRRPGRRPR
jgi:hypothetical protein